MKLILSPGSTSVIVHVFIPDSTSTAGAGKTALAFGDITAYYVRAGGALTALTMVDVTTLGTWDSDVTSDKLGFKKLDDTNAPGIYEVHLPANILAAGANQVVIQLRATGAAPTMLEIQLASAPADVRAILATVLTETSAGYLTAGFKKLFDVASPVLTAASVNQTGDSYARLGAPAGASVSADIAAIEAQTDDIGIAGAGLTAITGATLGATQGAITWGQQKIVANVAMEGGLDIRNSNALGIGLYNSGDYAGQYNVSSSIGMINIGTGANSTGNLNQGIGKGESNYGAGVAGVGQENNGTVDGQYNLGGTYGVQNAGASGQVNVGTAGDGIYASGTDYGIQATGVTGDIDPDFSALLTGVNVTSIANGAITAASIATNAIDADALATDAAAEIADAVWDEAIAGHLAAGSTGATLNGATAPTAAAVADAVWDEALAGHLAAGSTGNALNSAGGAATVFPTGAINFTYTVTDSATLLPLEGVEVWISTDNPAVNVVWKGDTDAFGVARDVLGNLPALDAGLYFFWRQLAGYTFSDPDSETVS